MVAIQEVRSQLAGLKSCGPGIVGVFGTFPPPTFYKLLICEQLAAQVGLERTQQESLSATRRALTSTSLVEMQPRERFLRPNSSS